MMVKWPSTITAMKRMPRPALASRSNSWKARPCGRRFANARAPAAPREHDAPHDRADAATTRKGMRQPHRWASCRPTGTPIAAATANAVMTMPIPAARRLGGTKSLTIARQREPETPPKPPPIARAISKVWALDARPQSSVATVKPAYATSRSVRRSKRSMKGALNKPTMPAATE